MPKLPYLCPSTAPFQVSSAGADPQQLRLNLSILLALLILLQSFSKVWVVFAFKLNQTYIAQTLCTNRNKPEMLCSGKCVLTERLKADDGAKGQQLPQKVKAQEDAVYCFEIPDGSPVAHHASPAEHQLPTYFHCPYASTFVRGIFHPPNPVWV